MNATEIAQSVGRHVAPHVAVGLGVRTGKDGVWRKEVGGSVSLLFDLASVTKPMTAAAAAVSGASLRAPLGFLLSEARGTASERVPLELFFAHRAGLAEHRPLYAPLVRGERVDVAGALREAADARRPDAEGEPPGEGFSPVYSSLGYALAGAAIAHASGSVDAGAAIAGLVLGPLGIADHAGTVRDLRARGVGGPFAATEDVPWRGGSVVGVVHDENAWALTGEGGSGHAGIFG
ncbi:MAG: serine hydrolase, partial [Polyangiaceae bacterium]